MMTRIVVDKSTGHAKAHFDLLNRVGKSLILATKIYEMQDVRPEVDRMWDANAGSLPEQQRVNVKAVLTSLNTAFLPISRSRFKQR